MEKKFVKLTPAIPSGSLYVNKDSISSIRQESTTVTELRMNNGDIIKVVHSIDQVISLIGEGHI